MTAHVNSERVDPFDVPEPEEPPAAAYAVNALRRRLERLDLDLIDLLADRVWLARHLSAAERDAGVRSRSPANEAAVVRKNGAAAERAGLDAGAVREISRRIVELSRGVTE